MPVKTVKVKVFVGRQASPRDFRLDWLEREDMAFEIRGDCPSDRKRRAIALQRGRNADDYLLVGSATAADGSEHVRLYVRPTAEVVQMAREPGWVPIEPPRQRSRMKRR